MPWRTGPLHSIASGDTGSGSVRPVGRLCHSLSYRSHLQLVTSLPALDGPQDEPGGRIVQDSALQVDRRVHSTVAQGDEPTMNSYESCEDFP
jgi:hypothetical protein